MAVDYREVNEATVLKVPKYELITDAAGESALVVERFDRLRTGKEFTRLPQEDALQLLGRWPASKYRITTREIFTAVTDVVSAPVVESLNLTKQFVFSYLIGNGDLHGKNVSVQHHRGLWRLTPAYDLLSTLPYGDRTMALQLEGKDDHLRPEAFVALASRHFVNEKATLRAIQNVCSGVESALDKFVDIGLSDRSTADLITAATERITNLRSKP